MLTVSTSDYLWYVDRALDEMISILGQLGDETANRRPDLDGANSPYVILTHCLGVIEYWGGYMVAGRSIERDRDAEFRSKGQVSHLIRRAAESRHQLEADIASADPMAAPRGTPDLEDAHLPLGKTQGAVLLHIYEELAQHLGQMQLTRDVLLSAG